MVRGLGCHHATAGASFSQVAGTAPLLADVDAEVRKHLYLGTYCIDVFMSLYLGHKPTVDGLDQIFADSVLDTYEELESWTPYTDPTTAGQQVPDHYESHPTYSISTFRALVDLLKVCHSIILRLYGDPKELTFASTQQAINDFDSQLGRWYETLPSFIRDSAISQTMPPPHLVDLLMADGPNPSLQKVIAQISSQETNLRGLSAVEGNQTASTGAITTSSTSTNHRGEASLTGGDGAASSDRHSTALDAGGISPVVQSSLIPTSDGGSYQESTSTAIHNPSIYVSRLLDLFSPVGATSFSQRWVHDATELSRNHPLLETALGAVSMLLIGKLDGDVDTEQSGELAYITVLRGVNELFRKKSESSASYHWIAALTLFERRGPFRHTSGMEHVLYSELRPLCVTWALTVRASTFLSKSEWKVIPWMGGGQKNVLHHLLDVLVDIPSFLEQVDTMNSLDGHQAAQKETQRELLTVWALSLRDALYQWKRTYADTYQDGEPYEVPQASGFPLFQHWSDEGGALSTPTAWMFPDPLLATSICMYNAAHLILMEAGNLRSSYEEPERYCYAWDICRSVQYYVQHVPWSFLLQIEFPLRVAYESLPETSVERTFIREVCSLICKNSKLEVFSSVTEGQHSESVVPCRGLQGTPED
ncbi:nitrogen assimilation transcription factor nit-4 [Aspergillus udagawae]|nr:nitrogen assimilation transcription factor nit-4 [Aspergillus udagawae]